MLCHNFCKCLTAAACLALVPLGAAKAQSSGGLIDEVRLGVLSHDVPGLWSGFRLEKGGVDLNGEVLFRPVLTLFGGTVRPVVGSTVHTAQKTSRAYVDARWQYTMQSGLFFGFGLGAGIHNGKLEPTDLDRKALGSRVLFHIPVEVGINLNQTSSLSIYFEHYSNGSIARHNEGLDALGVRYGHRF